MNKNIVIFVLVLVVIGEGYLLIARRRTYQYAMNNSSANTVSPKPSAPPRIPLLTKGSKLQDSPIFKFAYKIAPGDLNNDAESVLTGFNISKQNMPDGSIIVKLTPKDSDDQNQQYTIKPSETLYFIEQTPVDDKQDQDKDFNLRDDYGIIVDQNGIVQ